MAAAWANNSNNQTPFQMLLQVRDVLHNPPDTTREGSFLKTPSWSYRGVKSIPFFVPAQPLESRGSTGAPARSVTLSLCGQVQTGTNMTVGSRSSDSSPGEIPRLLFHRR